MTGESWHQRFYALCERPTTAAPLVWFRIAFGCVIIIECLRYLSHDWVATYYLNHAFHFKYFGFSWVRPWPGWGMYLHFIILGIAGLCMAVGFLYRVAAAVVFFGFTYIFLQDQSRYLNHHYLVCLISLLMMFMPAHRAFSVDAWRNSKIRSHVVPAWSLGLLRGQLLFVYFMAGVAKLNSDWLQGEPVRTWLLRRTDYPVLGSWFAEPEAAYFISYSGLLFDLLVAPTLLWRRTRLLALLLSTLFHLANHWLFGIGIFPWLSLAATWILFLPGLPLPFASLWHREEVKAGRNAELLAVNVTAHKSNWQRLGLTLMVGYILLQMLIPFRLWLYPGPVEWTEEGHRFSWRMMLRSKSGDFVLLVNRKGDQNVMQISPLEYLNERQYKKAATRPDMILQLCHHVTDQMRVSGMPEVEVRVLSMVSLNGRPPQLFIDPDVNLAVQPRTLFPSSWIEPLMK